MEYEEDKDFSFSLGSDHDCECCGGSWNHVEFHYDWRDEGDWMLQYHVGCYGGGELYKDDYTPEALKELFKYFRTFDNWEKSYEKQIKKEIKALGE